MWICSKCGEKLDQSFEVCWSCGTGIDGEEDPDFFSSDDDQYNAELDEIAGVPEQLVTIVKCNSPVEAYGMKLRLESIGVHVFLADEFTINMDWLLANAIGGIKVQVPIDDVARARAALNLIDEPDPAGVAEDEEAEEDEVDEDEVDESLREGEPPSATESSDPIPPAEGDTRIEEK